MMIRIFGFAMIVLIGCFTGAFVLVMSLKLGVIDALPQDEHLAAFKQVYMGGGTIVWIVASLCGVSTFYFDGLLRKITFLMPFLVPLIYTLSTLFYFSQL